MRDFLKHMTLSVNLLVFLLSCFLARRGFCRIMETLTKHEDGNPLSFWLHILLGTAAMLPLTMLIGLFFCG